MKNYLALFSLLICLVSIACSLSGSGQIGGAQATDVPHVVSAVQSTPTPPLATTATSAAPPALTSTHTPASQNDPTGTVSSELVVSPGATQTPSHTPTPTPTRMPTHDTISEAAVGLTWPNEVFFTGGGGGPTYCYFLYEELAGSYKPPFWSSFPALCLFYFVANEWVTIDLYGPDQNFLSSLTFRAVPTNDDFYYLVSLDGRLVGYGWDNDGKVLMELWLWESATMPIGDWRAIAAYEAKLVEGTIEVAFRDPSRPYVTIGPDIAYDPFYHNASRKNFSTGDVVVISGTGFNSQQSIGIGIYWDDFSGGTEPSFLVYSQSVTVDANGDFSIKLIVEADDPDGRYYVVLSTEHIGHCGDFDALCGPLGRFFTIRRLAQINCSGAAQTRLNVGFEARVAFTDGTPSRIRDLPASANVLATISEGTPMTIIGGPECHNQLVWWQVQTYGGLTGWLAEGRPGDYWLEPLDL